LCCLKTVQIAVQESNGEIVTNVTDTTAGKKRNNKRQVFLETGGMGPRNIINILINIIEPRRSSKSKK